MSVVREEAVDWDDVPMVGFVLMSALLGFRPLLEAANVCSHSLSSCLRVDMASSGPAVVAMVVMSGAVLKTRQPNS